MLFNQGDCFFQGGLWSAHYPHYQLVQAVRKKMFDGFTYLGVQLAPSLQEQVLVGYFLGNGMVEDVFQLRGGL